MKLVFERMFGFCLILFICIVVLAIWNKPSSTQPTQPVLEVRGPGLERIQFYTAEVEGRKWLVVLAGQGLQVMDLGKAKPVQPVGTPPRS